MALDANDSQPSRFWSYVIAALQTIETGVGHDLQQTLRAQRFQAAPIGQAEIEAGLAALINDLAQQSDRLIMILDELSTVDGASRLVEWNGDGHREFAAAECDDRAAWIDRGGFYAGAGSDHADRHRHASDRVTRDLVFDSHHGHRQRRDARGKCRLVDRRRARLLARCAEELTPAVT